MPVGVSAYIPLATVTLGTAASSVTFSSIPATYRDLVVVWGGLLTSGGQEVYLRYNGDSGSSYSYVEMTGTGSAATSSSSLSFTYAYGGVIYTTMANSIIQVMDYSATDKHKTGLTRSNNSANNVVAFAHRWANTAAITSLQLSLAGSSFAAGFTASLYGIAS